jgi:adenosylcobinamide-phosphate guanylyltransferase
MCGGRGTRLGPGEKPLQDVGGVAMVERVADALAASAVDRVYAVTAPHAPRTQARLDERGLTTIETQGDGYVADLQAALDDDRVEQPVLTVAADLPLLRGSVVDAVLECYERGALTVAVPAARVQALGYSVDTTMPVDGQAVRPAGLNVVADGPEATVVRRDRALAANVNRPRDLLTAAWHLAADRSRP